jgi:hypothetical protein
MGIATQAAAEGARETSKPRCAPWRTALWRDRQPSARGGYGAAAAAAALAADDALEGGHKSCHKLQAKPPLSTKQKSRRLSDIHIKNKFAAVIVRAVDPALQLGIKWRG